MFSEKIIAAIAVGVVFAVFFGVLIHAELVTDEDRFLVTELSYLERTVIDQPFEYPPASPALQVRFVEMLPGAESGWHTHDVPSVVTVIHGEVEVYYCDVDPQCSNIKRYEAGDSFVEAIDVKHNGVNVGLIPAKLHVVTLNPNDNREDAYSKSDP